MIQSHENTLETGEHARGAERIGLIWDVSGARIRQPWTSLSKLPSDDLRLHCKVLRAAIDRRLWLAVLTPLPEAGISATRHE